MSLLSHVGALTTADVGFFKESKTCDCQSCVAVPRGPDEGAPIVSHKCAIVNDGEMKTEPRSCALPPAFQKYSKEESVFIELYCSALCKPVADTENGACTTLTREEAASFGVDFGLSDRRIQSVQAEKNAADTAVAEEKARLAVRFIIALCTIGLYVVLLHRFHRFHF